MNLYLTDAGQALLYKAQGGKQLKFTRFGLGNGDLSGQAIQTLTNLISEKMSAEIKKLEIKSNKVVVGMSFSNSELIEGFYFRELGIYAEEPDTGEEILYMYGNFGETADYIDNNTGRVIEENLDVEIYISDVENITATIDGSLVYATQKDIEDIKAQIAGMVIPSKTSDLENDSGFIIEETDPTVPDWAKQANKPSYTFNEIGGKPDKYTPSDHTHTQNDITDLKIPSKTSEIENDSGFKKIEASTTDLEAGVSALTTGTIYLVYE